MYTLLLFCHFLQFAHRSVLSLIRSVKTFARPSIRSAKFYEMKATIFKNSGILPDALDSHPLSGAYLAFIFELTGSYIICEQLNFLESGQPINSSRQCEIFFFYKISLAAYSVYCLRSSIHDKINWLSKFRLHRHDIWKLLISLGSFVFRTAKN